MNSYLRNAILGLLGLLAFAFAAEAQQRPYIGFVYPAGGKQGATFQIKIGGQYLEGVNGVYVSGEGVEAKVLEYNKQLNPQEVMLLREQLNDLKKGSSGKSEETQALITKLEKRLAEYVQEPANAAVANTLIAEVRIAGDAKPGDREIRVETPRGLSNPLVFNIGQLPEYTAPPLPTSPKQVLGKEGDSLRRRTLRDVVNIKVPCIINGQIFSGCVDRYRFQAKKGQHIVIFALARTLVPYIADAVPGWFQAVLALHDAQGNEVAYTDDYRFKPDPVLFCEIPKDGEYVFSIYDAIYRGREDFVYRITIGELPFVTSIFPLGGRVGSDVVVEMKGWNLPTTQLTPNTKGAEPGIYPIAVRKEGFLSNRMLFALDTLPETYDREPNNLQGNAQRVTLPVIINGRIERPDDWDVFQFEGRAGDTIAVEVSARQLDSPLDSKIKLTDATGKQIAFNDDRGDIFVGQHTTPGLNTHHADSYLTAKLPATGTYYVHLRDTQGFGGEEYAYRLRISQLQPDFELRVVPSSVGVRSGGGSSVTVYALRKDGFAGDIKLGLRDAPPGFSLSGTIDGGTNQTHATLSVPADVTGDPVNLIVEDRATINGKEVVREAVPAEDVMQAFLWRHLVPAREFLAYVYDPDKLPASTRRGRGKGKAK
ncbi:MAG: PPC domain-containing protein [Verrucomicrobiae bacterium]|nr:PPC domain-containing protein [Verrucomicrobiae bacterium]